MVPSEFTTLPWKLICLLIPAAAMAGAAEKAKNPPIKIRLVASIRDFFRLPGPIILFKNRQTKKRGNHPLHSKLYLVLLYTILREKSIVKMAYLRINFSYFNQVKLLAIASASAFNKLSTAPGAVMTKVAILSLLSIKKVFSN